MGKPTYHIRGVLVTADSRRPMVGYAIIAETGVRDESSPLCLEGIRAGDRSTDADGLFQATFLTTGATLRAHENAPIPKTVEIHIEFSPGKWRCREVAVCPDQVTKVRGREAWLDLGRIEVDYDACREPVGREED